MEEARPDQLKGEGTVLTRIRQRQRTVRGQHASAGSTLPSQPPLSLCGSTAEGRDGASHHHILVLPKYVGIAGLSTCIEPGQNPLLLLFLMLAFQRAWFLCLFKIIRSYIFVVLSTEKQFNVRCFPWRIQYRDFQMGTLVSASSSAWREWEPNCERRGIDGPTEMNSIRPDYHE